jgi:hypothetical protein
MVFLARICNNNNNNKLLDSEKTGLVPELFLVFSTPAYS